MNVTLLDLKAQYRSIKSEIDKAMEKVCDNQSFILGEEVGLLEEQVAAYSGARYGVGVASGTDALLLALMAANVGYGDEVITTPFTFFATAGSISRLGARPVFADIDPDTFNIVPEKTEAKITKKTKAVIPVHLYGQCAEMDGIMELAKRHNLAVIEDAAQAIGSEYKGRRAGSIGGFGCFSFFPSKNLGGFGDGGMITTNDTAYAENLKILRVHGSKPKYYHSLVGINSRLDTLQAAVLVVKLRYLDSWTKARQANAARYNKLVAAAGLSEIVKTPVSMEYNRHIYNQYTLRVPNRDGLIAFLKEKGIGTEIYYPVPLHLQECFKDLGYKKGDMPESESAALETISLPIFPELTPEQQEYVVDMIREFYKK